MYQKGCSCLTASISHTLIQAELLDYARLKEACYGFLD